MKHIFFSGIMKFEEYVGKHKLVRFSAFLAGFQALFYSKKSTETVQLYITFLLLYR